MYPCRATTTLLPKTSLAGLLLTALLFLFPSPLVAQQPAIAGDWVFNEQLSDNTDRRVEAALRAAGQRIQRRLFDRSRDRYRGGPEEHELYDRMSYDRSLRIELDGDEYSFTYDDGWVRPVYTDNRSRSVSLSAIAEVRDFSFAHWEGERLLVEGRPRDGGFSDESYELIEGGNRLRVKLYILPHGFLEAIEITRVYDRRGVTPAR